MNARLYASPCCTLTLLTALVGQPVLAADAAPTVGDMAPDFELSALDGGQVKLSKLTDTGPVVLVVLRGYPGYQCPLCTRQFGEYLNKANGFKQANAKVVFVYPGPADNLTKHAGDFVRGKTIPDHFYVLLDPDYTFTKPYGLRWDAKNETAYPSTFVLDSARKVAFANVSKSHGGRVKADDALQALLVK